MSEPEYGDEGQGIEDQLRANRLIERLSRLELFDSVVALSGYVGPLAGDVVRLYDDFEMTDYIEFSRTSSTLR